MNVLNDFLFSTTVGSAPTVVNLIAVLISSAILGLIIAAGYMFVTKNEGFSPYFVTALIILPAVISVIIMMIGSNIAKAFSLGGVFALIRFRSEPGNPRDITYICITMAAGLACGTGYIGYGLIFVLFVMVLLLIINAVGLGSSSKNRHMLKITVPEDFDFENVFDDVFEKYTENHKLDKIKTADFGSLYQLQYGVKLKKGVNSKDFLDEIRVLNANLNVSMSTALYELSRKTF